MYHLFISCSDHKAVVAEFKNNNFERGPSSWQFNCSLLNDTNYITFMNNLIDNFIKVNTKTSSQKLWELLKAEIKASTIQFCTEKNFLSKLNYENTLKEIERVSTYLSNLQNVKLSVKN